MFGGWKCLRDWPRLNYDSADRPPAPYTRSAEMVRPRPRPRPLGSCRRRWRLVRMVCWDRERPAPLAGNPPTRSARLGTSCLGSALQTDDCGEDGVILGVRRPVPISIDSDAANVSFGTSIRHFKLGNLFSSVCPGISGLKHISAKFWHPACVSIKFGAGSQVNAKASSEVMPFLQLARYSSKIWFVDVIWRALTRLLADH